MTFIMKQMEYLFQKKLLIAKPLIITDKKVK